VVKIKQILLTFDIEEFDMPIELGKEIGKDEQFKISEDGTKNLLNLLDKNNILGTFFVSAVFAEKYPELIKKISEKHEVGLHCYEHGDNYSKMDSKIAFEKLQSGKEILEEITNKKIKSFRAPRFQPPDYDVLNKLELKYDSSYHPTWIPGRYNNFFKTNKRFLKEGVNVIPVSVSPLLRLPMFWLAFRNMPLFYSKRITHSCKDLVCLVFHPWEFVNISKYDLPLLIKRKTGNKLIEKLGNYINWGLKKEFKFTTISQLD
tara:strand:+ start:157 stop:939 length:783 start_codon:yes stop_codon:yes gene_type:complete